MKKFRTPVFRPARSYFPRNYNEGVFRCERCDRKLPESQLVEQDGLRICHDLCSRDIGAIEQQERLSIEMSQPDSMETSLYPPQSAFTGAVGITGISPALPIALRNSGSPVTVSLTGFGFSSADVISYGHAGITNASAPVVVSTTSVTLSVQAAAVPAGDYSLTYNGTVWRGAFRVR